MTGYMSGICEENDRSCLPGVEKLRAPPWPLTRAAPLRNSKIKGLAELNLYMAAQDFDISEENKKMELLSLEGKQKQFLGIVPLSRRCHIMRMIPKDFTAAFPAYCMPVHGGSAAFYFPELPMGLIEKSPDIVNMVSFVRCSCFTRFSVLSKIRDMEPIQFFGKAKSQAQLRYDMDTF